MMSPTLAMERIMLHPRYPELVQLVRKAAPVHLRDQADAAASDAADVLQRVGSLIADEAIRSVDPEAIPGWLRLGVLDAFVGFVNSTASTCRHSPSPDRPTPVYAALWKPGLITCGPCAYLFAIGRGTTADRTCDCCGHVCAGVDDGDGIHPCMVQLGPLTVQYGVCGSCSPPTDRPSVPHAGKRTEPHTSQRDRSTKEHP